MSANGIGGRLVRLEQRLAPPRPAEDPIAIICPDRWPLPARQAFRAAEAAGDVARMDDLIEEQTGRRPPPRPGGRGRIIEVAGIDPADV